MAFNKIELSSEKLNIIVAYTDKDRFMAYQNDLPWKRSLKGDLRFINLLIRSKPNIALILGRCTYESLPKYKDIKIIVVTSSNLENVTTFDSFSKAVEYCSNNNLFKVIFGGVKIYEEALNYPHVAFCTVVEQKNLLGDRIAPNINLNFENITKNVEEYLLENNVNKTWEYKKESFQENGFIYNFYYGE